MANFVGDYIGLGKISRRAKPRLQLTEKRQVKVKLFITGTVEGTNRSARGAASRTHLICKQDQRRFTIALSLLAKYVGPNVLGAGQHCGGELLEFLFFRVDGTRALRPRGRRFAGRLFQELAWICSKQEGDDQQYNTAQSASDSQPSA